MNAALFASTLSEFEVCAAAGAQGGAITMMLPQPPPPPMAFGAGAASAVAVPTAAAALRAEVVTELLQQLRAWALDPSRAEKQIRASMQLLCAEPEGSEARRQICGRLLDTTPEELRRA